MKLNLKLLLGLMLLALLLMPLLTFAQAVDPTLDLPPPGADTAPLQVTNAAPPGGGDAASPKPSAATPAPSAVGGAATAAPGNISAVDAAVIVGPLLILGMILKNAWESFPNRFIPLVMLVFGIPMFMVKSGSSWTSMDAWVTAILVTTSAVGIHSGLKNNAEGLGLLSKKVGVWFLLGLLPLAFFNTAMTCRPLDAGARPIVVRTEQASSSAKATFELVLNTDHANRGWWKANAPAFHAFAESLREPVPCAYNGGTTNLPKWAATLWSVDRVKQAYKAGTVSSNALLTATATLNAALNEANTWLAFTATNHP